MRLLGFSRLSLKACLIPDADWVPIWIVDVDNSPPIILYNFSLNAFSNDAFASPVNI